MRLRSNTGSSFSSPFPTKGSKFHPKRQAARSLPFSFALASERFRCFRFVWAPDGRRVRLEADGEIVAAADLVKKKLIVRGGDGRAASSGGWSPQGHDWDDSLLEEFDRSPEKPLSDLGHISYHSFWKEGVCMRAQ